MEPPALRWLPSRTLEGAWQMALDAWLLQQVVATERTGPLLRFYRWSRPTLSLGKNQNRIPPRWLRLVEADRLALVRRPSGGAAVLHGGDLTYALIWPKPPRRRREAYRLCCRWLQEAFADLGHPLAFGDSPCLVDQPNCFASSTAADLVHPDGQKRVGSAQLWRSGALLQHGSVQLEPDPGLWEEVFNEPAPCLPGLSLAGEPLEAHLLASALRWLPWATDGEGRGDQGMARPREEVLGEEEWRAIGATVEQYQALLPVGQA